MITQRDKERARSAVSSAIRKGTLTRGCCEQEESGVCKGQIEGHHDDYMEPLDVRWLCKRHHLRFHQDHPEVAGGTDQKAKRSSRTTRRISISLPDELGEAVKALAKEERRSVSNMLTLLLEDGLRIAP